jgi:hypothetical protein
MIRLVQAFCTLLAANLAAPIPAVLAAEEDTQLWAGAMAMVDVGRGDGGKPLVIMADWQYRYADDASRLGQVTGRVSLGIRVRPTLVLSQGYAYLGNRAPAGATTREHRPFQQAMFRIIGNGKGPTMIGRTRLEERFVEGSPDMGLRARQMLRGTAPLGGGFLAIGTAEAFVNLNSASWGPRSGFDQSRVFAGVGVPLARGLWIEAGYMNQYVVRHRRADRMNHNISLTLSLVR